MTREQFVYGLKSCGFTVHHGEICYEHDELIKCFEDLGLLEPTPKNDLGVDYISKQEVVGLMMHIWGKNHSGDDAMQECIDTIRDMSSVTTQEPRWISVTEDVPPIGTICLWCNKHGSVFTSEITYRSEFISRVGKHGYFNNGIENHGDIVAWMPLPKAYREVEE